MDEQQILLMYDTLITVNKRLRNELIKEERDIKCISSEISSILDLIMELDNTSQVKDNEFLMDFEDETALYINTL